MGVLGLSVINKHLTHHMDIYIFMSIWVLVDVMMIVMVGVFGVFWMGLGLRKDALCQHHQNRKQSAQMGIQSNNMG